MPNHFSFQLSLIYCVLLVCTKTTTKKRLLVVYLSLLSTFSLGENGHITTQLLTTSMGVGVNSGRPVAPNFVPSVVQILRQGSLKCTGTLIGKCVLTARHCLRDSEYPYSDRYKESSVFQENSKEKSEIETAAFEDPDIAVAKLKTPINFGASDESILSTEEPKRYSIAAAIGYGENEAKSPRKVIGRLLTTEIGLQIESVPFPSALSNGDSGGPLVVLDQNGKPKLVGVLSNIGTFEGDQRGRYLSRHHSIFKNKEWIKKTVEKFGCFKNTGTLLLPEKAFEGIFGSKSEVNGFVSLSLTELESERLARALRADMSVEGKKDFRESAGIVESYLTNEIKRRLRKELHLQEWSHVTSPLFNIFHVLAPKIIERKGAKSAIIEVIHSNIPIATIELSLEKEANLHVYPSPQFLESSVNSGLNSERNK